MLRHHATLAVLAISLFLRVLVPAGWMPAATGGAFAIEPCPAAGPARALHQPGHHHGAGHDHQSHGAAHDGDCAFAPLAASVAAFDFAPGVVAPALAAQAAAPTFATPALKTGPPALPPPATGPPILA